MMKLKIEFLKAEKINGKILSLEILLIKDKILDRLREK